MGRMSKRKGNRIEREIVNLLKEAGVHAKRVPLSGQVGGSFVIEGVYRAEVKARAGRWLRDYRALEGRERCLILETGQAASAGRCELGPVHRSDVRGDAARSAPPAHSSILSSIDW